MNNFHYTPSVLTNLEHTLSSARLNTYKNLVLGDPEKALKLYIWNTRLSESLYAPIQGFEICLRNTLHNSLSNAYTDSWYDVCYLESRELERIAHIKRHLKETGKLVSTLNIVAATNLGFWVGILDRLYENDLWRPYLRYAFINTVNPLRRKHVFAIVNQTRRLRNRIAHHEPILKRKLDEDFGLILQLVGWICKDTETWIRQHSQFDKVWKQPPN